MPRYDAKCDTCNKVREVIAKNLSSFKPCECGGKLEWIPMVNAYTFKPIMHPHLGHTPVEITSWSQYKRELKKRGLVNELAS